MSAEPAAPSLTLQAHRRLYDDIISARLLPGGKLKIGELTQRYEIGASPIREALSLLTSDGLVERIDQRGFRVADVSRQAFEELLRTRIWLEDRGLRESIQHGTVEWEERIVIAFHRLSRLPRLTSTGEEAVEWEGTHKSFHMALISACRSDILLRMCSQLYDRNIRYRVLAAGRSYPQRDVGEEHRQIMQAAVDRHADLATARLIAHYETTRSYLDGAWTK